MTLTLFHNDGSTCAQKVRLVLAEKALPWVDRPLDLRAGEQRDPDYLALNPKGIVPTLVHSGHVVTESTVIAEYLDDAFPKPPLRPGDPPARARMRLWAKRIDDQVHAMTGVLSFALAFRHDFLAMPDRGAAITAARDDPMERMARASLIEQGADFQGVGRALTILQRMLADIESGIEGDYLVGDFTLADACWAPYIARLEHLRLGFLWKDHSKLSAWWGRLQARPAYAEAMTARLAPARLKFMAQKAEEAMPRVKQWLEAA